MKVLRVVTLASATGKYGGPFDTAVSQSRLCADTTQTDMTLLAGSLPNDCPRWEPQSFRHEFSAVRKLAKHKGFTTCISWRLINSLIRNIRNCDLVHISYAREITPILAALLALYFRKAVVLQPHGMLTARSSRLHRVVDVLARPIFRRADRVIALTDVELSELQDWSGLQDEHRYSVIGNPLPFQPKQGSVAIAAKKDRALFIARLEHRKRVTDFLDAQRCAQARGWDEIYEVVGPDQGDGDVVRIAAEESPHLVYRGAVPATEINDILESAGVFVLTSRNEPWGNVLVAALVKGIPVVVTESAALAAEIERNHLGLVVPDASPEMVAIAVHDVLTKQWRTPEQVETAKSFCSRRFNQSAIRQQLQDTYVAALLPKD